VKDGNSSFLEKGACQPIDEVGKEGQKKNIRCGRKIPEPINHASNTTGTFKGQTARDQRLNSCGL